ncbi:hypothetical protein J2R78_008123 [Bradyrhizobium sp. USDA 4538]|uniref:hypothetical protein n=1 Tax=Bradyrhizobium TaxID=374 RepID=UPI00209E5EAC|nr:MULTISPECIES: hypothetical protein [Bradyrhizobium]MCP1845156.1 hypothetical protein [Bradyrhizobium sp. USDA 4538]MCP1905721.1 hypothetical protein [Bradyrhizobium sp. USDA 4537]MCP1988623.1 hypothetical protein [Bradyrhizobium sp. USDA 4539]MCP3418118.1 hypothetical protein [Bradyrhizobium brasilense]
MSDTAGPIPLGNLTCMRSALFASPSQNDGRRAEAPDVEACACALRDHCAAKRGGGGFADRLEKFSADAIHVARSQHSANRPKGALRESDVAPLVQYLKRDPDPNKLE